jgi:hypothetical protein
MEPAVIELSACGEAAVFKATSSNLAIRGVNHGLTALPAASGSDLAASGSELKSSPVSAAAVVLPDLGMRAGISLRRPLLRGV